jgi:hypothetical protein
LANLLRTFWVVKKILNLLVNNLDTLALYYNNFIFTEKDIISIIIGSLLGNCEIIKMHNICYIVFNQIKSNKENYLLIIYYKLIELGYCTIIKTNLKNFNHKTNRSYYIYLKFYMDLNWIHEMFYPKNRKIIPKNIGNYITPLSISMWLINDGALIKNKGILFKANCFTLNEIKLISNILNENYNIQTSIVKTGVINQYNIYIIKSSKNILKNIVKPFISPIILYNLFYL